MMLGITLETKLMKFVHVRGCMSNHTSVDGRSYPGDFSEAELDYIEKVLFENISVALRSEAISLSDVLGCIPTDETNWSEPCDQCGDTVVTETWELN
jgi:hypothetical protein